MDRRKLHKVNGQTVGKNRQISSRARANNRAAQQDAHREIQPEEAPVTTLSRLERMKLWRIQREEKKKEEEQQKKKPFVTVVKRGVFLDKTNYTELNKLRRKKLGATKANAGQNLPMPAQNETGTSHSNLSRRGREIVTAAEVVSEDNQNDNVELLAISNDTSALNGTFETETPEANSNTVYDGDLQSVSTPAAGANMLTVPDVTPHLNTTFEMENSAENNGISQANQVEGQATRSETGDINMLTVPENTSVLNTTFEMQNSAENVESSVEVSIEISNLLSGRGNSENTPARRRPSIRSTPRSVKSANTSEGTRPTVKSTPRSVKSANTSEGTRPTVKSTPKPVRSESVPEEETSSIKHTPKSVLNTSLNYVSPFVTISRGKGSAQKEVKVRESFYKLEISQSEHDSPVIRQNHAAAEYFRGQVNAETNNLMENVDNWSKYKDENAHIDSVYLDQIDVAIGQTRLLINKKFKQFLGLCDDCQNGTSQPPVLAKDLEGFWSMVYMQVENCGARFQKLVTLRDSNWVEPDLLPVKVVKQTKNRKGAKKGGVASSGIQKMIEEARLKMKESKISATTTSSSNTDVGNVFSMTLRQTPARQSLTGVVKTPRSIIKVKTPGLKRITKSVAFSFNESPSTSESLKVAGTPNSKVIRRRASTTGVPSEKKTTTEAVSAFYTPNNRKVSTATPATSTDRRSSRRLFSNAEK